MTESMNTIASYHTKRAYICTCITLLYGFQTFDTTISQKMKKDSMTWGSLRRPKCVEHLNFIYL